MCSVPRPNGAAPSLRDAHDAVRRGIENQEKDVNAKHADQHARSALAVVGQPFGALVADESCITHARLAPVAARASRPGFLECSVLAHPPPSAIGPAYRIGIAELAEMPFQRKVCSPGFFIDRK